MTLNDTAARFLQTYAAGSEPEGGWLHAKALQQTRLDFTPESLDRLDSLLAQIRQRARPTAEALADTRGRNFMRLIAFYVIEITRRRTGADLVWQSRTDALSVLPAGARLPDTPYTQWLVNASDQGRVFMPLAWLSDQLLNDDHVVPAANYVAGLVRTLEENGPPVWWQAAHAMGRIASYQMMMAADGGSVVPMMLGQRMPSTWVMLMSGANLAGEDIDEALQRGGRQLDTNKEGHAWQVLSYDGWLDQDGQKLDAVMVIAKTYGERPLYLKIAFPYRPARDGSRFAILQPALREGNVPDETVGQLTGALERGIQSVKWAFGTTWDELREHDGGAPPPRPATPSPAWAAPAPARSPAARPAPPAKKGWKPW